MSVTIHPMPAQTQTAEAHPTIRVYNTLSKKKEPFVTVLPDKVGIYLCGPTVYDKAHIGHMVGPVIFDCIKRYLTYCGYEVTWVVNITDVDDKLIKKANERGISMLQVAEENIDDYNQNLAALGVDQIDQFPRATDCMPEIIGFIEQLVKRGYAYESDGDVYFDVGKDAEYGKLSNRSIESMQGEGGETAARKRHAADFALWKSAKPGEPSWKSPWGEGRPGWHIECSAMSKKILGETFDIHGGGLDLVFPHHENEIAQSECCHAQPMVRYWAHNGLLRAGAAAGKVGGRGEREGAVTPGPTGSASAVLGATAGLSSSASAPEPVSGKMSRSKGAGGLADLIKRQGGERIRFFLLRTHYRSTVLFNEPAIEEAGIGLEGFYRLFKRYTRITGNDFYAIKTPTSRGNHVAESLRDSDSTVSEKPSPANDPVLQAATCRQKFIAAMDDDFNTGGAIGELFELAKIANKFCDDADLERTGKIDTAAVAKFTALLTTIKELSSILGIFQHPPALPGGASDDLLAKIMPLVIELRATARKNKNFAVADKIRDGLAPLGLALEDRAGGTEWTRVEGRESRVESQKAIGGENLGATAGLSSSAPSATGSASADGVMKLLIQLRADARTNKDFATGDMIRDKLTAAGITLEDRAGGTEWTKV